MWWASPVVSVPLSTATLVSAGFTAGALGAGFDGALLWVVVWWALVCDTLVVDGVDALFLVDEPPSEVSATTATATTITAPAISANIRAGERAGWTGSSAAAPLVPGRTTRAPPSVDAAAAARSDCAPVAGRGAERGSPPPAVGAGAGGGPGGGGRGGGGGGGGARGARAAAPRAALAAAVAGATLVAGVPCRGVWGWAPEAGATAWATPAADAGLPSGGGAPCGRAGATPWPGARSPGD